MSVDTKRLHILVDDGLALLAAMMRSGLLIVRGRLSTCGQWVRRRMVEIRWKAILERQIINRTSREKEAWLARQMTDPVEATVLVDDKHRLVAANQAALSMLGISERNINKFMMDAFVSCRESGLEPVGQSSVRKRNEWRICKFGDWMAARWWVNSFFKPMSPQEDTYQGFAMWFLADTYPHRYPKWQSDRVEIRPA